MTLQEAYNLLDIHEDAPDDLLKANYRWLIWFYHPDTKLGNDTIAFSRVLEAYSFVRKCRDNHGRETIVRG
jgi:DnaJ-class molecular chaperone